MRASRRDFFRKLAAVAAATASLCMPRPIRTISIKVAGHDRALRRISRLKGLPRNLVNLQRTTADRIVETARRNVSVDTGQLYATIQRRNTEAGAIASAGEYNPNPPSLGNIPGRQSPPRTEMGAPAPYALQQELPGPKSRNPWYMTNAYHEHVDELREKHLRKTVREATRG